ncbi:MAG: uracil-DNA glycosylase family protein [Halobacteriaceae archaeon]
MDAEQDAWANPFGMDEACEQCRLCETRERVVHGYGDVGADFLFVAARPTDGAEATGVPLTGDARGERFHSVLGRLGLNNSLPSSDRPELDDAFLTLLTRCRDPDRGPRDDEVAACEPFLNAEIRTINPEILIPVGERPFRELLADYTTDDPDDYRLADAHATTIRGRGFELVPMKDPADQSDADAEAFVNHFLTLMDRDYRQTKGRRSR